MIPHLPASFSGLFAAFQNSVGGLFLSTIYVNGVTSLPLIFLQLSTQVTANLCVQTLWCLTYIIAMISFLRNGCYDQVVTISDALGVLWTFADSSSKILKDIREVSAREVEEWRCATHHVEKQRGECRKLL